MNCRQARRLLQENLENSLTDRELSVLREHLAACPNCCRVEKELRAALSFVRQALPPVLPSGLRQSVLQKIQSEKTAGRQHSFAQKNYPAVAAAAVFILLLAGNMLLSVLPAFGPVTEAPAPEAQLRTMLQDSNVLSVPPAPAAPESVAGPVVTEQGDRRFAEAVQADDAAAREDLRPGRPAVVWRLLLNVLLVPLFIYFTWRAVKTERVV